MSKRIYPNSKDRILEAAKAILIQEGMGKLSTDNLIQKSGLSKGGFFYHFKTKNDLFDALSIKIVRDMKEAIEKLRKKDPIKKGSTLRAYINFSLSKENDEITAVCKSIVEIVFDKKNPNMETYKEFGRELVKDSLAEGMALDKIMTIFLTLDGYWYNDVFGHYLFSKSETKKHIKNLMKLTE